MSDKHYHNDIKKIMGIDETRSKSQKIIDKAMRIRQTTSIIKVQRQQPQKKVKRQRQQKQLNEGQTRAQVDPQAVMQKILKSLSTSRVENSNSSHKYSKSLQILKKIIKQSQFLSKLKPQTLHLLSQKLIKHSNRWQTHPSIGQAIKIREQQIQILSSIHSQFNKKQNEEQETLKQKYQILKQVKLYVLLSKLITDDSFKFSSDVFGLKMEIFKMYQQEKKLRQEKDRQQNQVFTTKITTNITKNTNQSQISKNPQSTDAKNTKTTLFIQHYIFPKLLTLPNINFQWAKTGINNLMKQFINNYKNQLQNPKQLLTLYNNALQNKNKKSVEIAASDIVGDKRSISGGTFTTIQSYDSTAAWCKRQ